MELQPVVAAAGLAVVSTVSVSLWTLRVALAARGRRVAASVTASLEAVLFALAFARVLDALDDPLRVVGYAAGVAVGTFSGLTLEAGSERRRTTADDLEPPEGDGRSISHAGATLAGPRHPQAASLPPGGDPEVGDHGGWDPGA